MIPCNECEIDRNRSPWARGERLNTLKLSVAVCVHYLYIFCLVNTFVCSDSAHPVLGPSNQDSPGVFATNR